MLVLAITLFLLAALIIGFTAVGHIAAGAVAFSIGFLILASIAGLSFWRSRLA